jgi:cbb3-type cytochrome oxidase maturation protein
MSIIYVVLPLALLLVLGAVLVFVWAARSGQFDDMETPALRMLHDDPARPVRPADAGDHTTP